MGYRGLQIVSSNFVMLTPQQVIMSTQSLSAGKETCWLWRLLEIGDKGAMYMKHFFCILHFDLLFLIWA